jgi:hypothetical protein
LRVHRPVSIAFTWWAAASLAATVALADSPCPSPVPEALAAAEPAPDGSRPHPSFLVRGQSYRASEPITLAPSKDAPVEKVPAFYRAVPANEAFLIADAVYDEGKASYLVRSGYRYGWVKAAVLATMKIEASDNPRFDCCAEAKAKVRDDLTEVHRQRSGLGASPTVEQLVSLDARIRKIIADREECWSEGGDVPLDDSKGDALGLSIGHYTGDFDYNGKLLREAHAIDPKSPSRPITLYSTVERAGESGGVDLPDFRAAKAYLREFPKGPFAADAALKLAGAYKDAYLARHCDQHLDCVADQLDDLKDKPSKEQEAQAEKMADSYLKQAIRLRPADQELREWRDDWRECPPGYTFCAD